MVRGGESAETRTAARMGGGGGDYFRFNGWALSPTALTFKIGVVWLWIKCCTHIEPDAVF